MKRPTAYRYMKDKDFKTYSKKQDEFIDYLLLKLNEVSKTHRAKWDRRQ